MLIIPDASCELQASERAGSEHSHSLVHLVCRREVAGTGVNVAYHVKLYCISEVGCSGVTIFVLNLARNFASK